MKKVLIVTYYWPPAGGPGVQRWLKFVKYFRDFGIEPIVYIPENPNYPLMDDQFADEVPADIEIIKQAIREPYRFANMFSKKKTGQMSSGIISEKQNSPMEKLMLYVRGNFFIPDARVGWVNPSVKYLSEYLLKNPVDTLITTGPPHSLHLIGLKLKTELGITWIADFRDPWTSIHYHKSLRLNKASETKHKALEAAVLNGADTIVVTSPTTKKEFSSITPKPIEIITNGYDISERDEISLDNKFTVSHIGSLLSERNPKVLWKVLEELINENLFFKENFQLQFAGTISEEIKESLHQFNLLEHSIFYGYVSHSKAIELQRKSQVLLLVEMDRPETNAIIPGKLFEYLAARRPILALGPKESDIKSIVEDARAGIFFGYEQAEELKSEILHFFSQYKNGSLTVSLEGIEKYSRRELTRKMAALIFHLSSNSSQ